MPNKTILIVEDETPMRKVLAEELERNNFNVLQAENGEEGLEIALDKKPDITLLDIVMPKMDGLEMLKNLREDEEWGKDAKVLLLTNYSDVEKISESVQIGISGYLVKSDWKLEDVVRKIKDKLEKEER